MQKESSQKNVAGFTLIELLVSIAIVGILTAVAVPQYKVYRQRAFDSVVLADVRSLVLAEEAYFLDNQKYQPCQNETCSTLPGIIRLSKGVTAQISIVAAAYTIRARHPQGSKEFLWDSEQGGLVQ